MYPDQYTHTQLHTSLWNLKCSLTHCTLQHYIVVYFQRSQAEAERLKSKAQLNAVLALTTAC